MINDRGRHQKKILLNIKENSRVRESEMTRSAVLMAQRRSKLYHKLLTVIPRLNCLRGGYVEQGSMHMRFGWRNNVGIFQISKIIDFHNEVIKNVHAIHRGKITHLGCNVSRAGE